MQWRSNGVAMNNKLTPFQGEHMNDYEDDEFNRIEMESRVRQMYVRQAMDNVNEALRQLEEEGLKDGIPFVTKQDMEELLKNS
jgi:hypothetical protein